MNGLELASSYYTAHREALLAPFAAYRPRIAAGLVGFGSECFGFDDALSQDHDFGPGFCLWLTDADFATIGPALQAAYDALPASHAGFSPRQNTPRSGRRVGVFAISAFYAQFLGAPDLPISEADWLQIPEELLAAAVNGRVFEDPYDEFSRIRRSLSGYYPDSILRLKLATATAKMAQSGQYNLPRALTRSDAPAALLALADFIRNTGLLFHALHKRYAPHEKWLIRSLQDIPGCVALAHTICQLAQAPTSASAELVEAICAQALKALISQGFTQPGDAFLECHVDSILGSAHQDIRT